MAFDIGTFLSGLGGSLVGRVGTEAAPAPAGGLSTVAPDEEEMKIPETTDDARNLYFKELSNLRRQQNALLASLEARSASGPQEMLRNISAAMLDPGRTGNFGEAFGRMQTGLSRQAAEDESRAAQIAKMRLELNQQNVGMAEKGIALAQQRDRTKALQGFLGTDPAEAGAGEPGASIAGSSLAAKLPLQLRKLIATMDPNEGIKEVTKYLFDEAKTPEAIKELNALIQSLPPSLRASAMQSVATNKVMGMPADVERAITDLRKAYDNREISREDLESGLARLNAFQSKVSAARTTTAEPMFGADGVNRYVVDTDEQAQALANQLRGTDQRFTVSVRPGQTAVTGASPSAAPIAPPAVAPVAPTAAAPVAAQRATTAVEPPSKAERDTQQAILKEQQLAIENEAKPLREAVMAANPSVTGQQDRNLRELMQILKRNEENVKNGGMDIFGLLQKQGVISAIYNAANEGVRVMNQGSITLPAQKFLEALQVPEHLRPMLTRATQILADQFLLNARANKGVLGAQVSNFDAQMFKAPTASVEDSSKSIEYWTRLNLLANKERQQTYQAFNRQPAAQRTQFFSSPEYQRIVDQYSDYYGQFVKKYAPFNASSAAQESPTGANDLTGTVGRVITNIIKP